MRILGILIAVAIAACGQPDENASKSIAPAPERIVSLSGTLTELLYDLGYGDQLVGADITSTYPAAADTLPKLGHVSRLNVEGLLALEPTLVFVDAAANENEALATLREAGVKVVGVPMQPSLDNAARAARTLARHLDIADAEIEAYAERIAADSTELANKLADVEERPRVLFVYARGAGRLMVAGRDTEAASMIELSGGRNAITSFADFKPLTPEALVEAAPELILMFTSGLESLDGPEGLAEIPGIAATPAYRENRIVTMDGHYLLGFGPRAARAATELAGHLHPQQTK